MAAKHRMHTLSPGSDPRGGDGAGGRPAAGRRRRVLIPKLLHLLLVCVIALWHAPAPTAAERDAAAVMRESTWKALRAALDALEAGQEAEADAALAALVPLTRDHPYEQAVVRQAQGHLLLQQERPREALQAFRDALDEQQRLPAAVVREIGRHVIRIHIVLEEYAAALAALDRLPDTPPDAEALWLRGHALFMQERWSAAATALQGAIRASTDPPVAWRELLLAAHLHAEALPQAAVVLEGLITVEPKRADWWRQLAAVYQRLGALRAAAAALAAAQRLGILEPRELLDLARLLLYTGQPVRAAALLAEAHRQARFTGLEGEALLLLADAYALAREPGHAIAFLEAAGPGASAALLARLGRLQFNEAQWEAAWRSLERAAQGGPAGGSPAARAEDTLLAGIAAWQAGAREAATALLARAERESSTRDRARRWLERVRAQG